MDPSACLQPYLKKLGNISYINNDIRDLFCDLEFEEKIDLALYVYLHIHDISDPIEFKEAEYIQKMKKPKGGYGIFRQ